MRTPITYYGGKQELADRIIGFIPQHKIYVEPFFGGGAVFFKKAKSYLEVINDINDKLILFYKYLQEYPDEIISRVKNTIHSESLYYQAKDIYNSRVEASELDIAWSIWYITNCSFSGSAHGGWKWCNGSSGSHTAVFLDRKRNELSNAYFDRLKRVQISNRDAIRVIDDRDSVDTFFYLDPPYPGSVQQHYNGYDFKQYIILLKKLSSIKGKFILSNYESQTLKYFIIKNNWYVHKISKTMKVNNRVKNRKKTKAKELLITNFKINQLSLFEN